MNKKFVAFILAFVMIGTFFASDVMAAAGDIQISATVNGSDISLHTTSGTALSVSVSSPIVIAWTAQNTGPDTEHLNDIYAEVLTVTTILFWDLENKVWDATIDVDGADTDGDGKEGFDIPGNASDQGTITIDPTPYKDALSGRKVKINVTFNFEGWSKTITVYVQFST